MTRAKPTLVVALGNRLMGDDAIACDVADRLAADQVISADVELIVGENDLLRIGDRLAEKERLIILDAAQDGAAPGTVSLEDGLHLSACPCNRQAHTISPVETLELLRAVGQLPADVKLLTISVGSVRVSNGLSPALERALPNITNRVARLIMSGRGP
jgi:hydrogenase maturation protease